MSNQREELKTRLLARAEATIERMLGDGRVSDRMTLSEIEQVIGESGADFRQAALEEMVSMQGEHPSQCPVCAGRLQNRGKRKKQLISLQGETTVERNYYRCQECGRGYFPPR